MFTFRRVAGGVGAVVAGVRWVAGGLVGWMVPGCGAIDRSHGGTLCGVFWDLAVGIGLWRNR